MENLRAIRKVKGVKKVFVRSGLRYDYLMEEIRRHHSFTRDNAGKPGKGKKPKRLPSDKNQKPDQKVPSFFQEFAANHVSGQLKVAPEHASAHVLILMNKPQITDFQAFSDLFKKANTALGMRQFLIPYLISGHPGSTLSDAIELALFLKQYGFVPDQVQDFYPTPGTLSTCMYHTGVHPLTGEEVYVPKDHKEKQLQRALLHFHKPQNRNLVRQALIKAGRRDLIGPQGLVPK